MVRNSFKISSTVFRSFFAILMVLSFLYSEAAFAGGFYLRAGPPGTARGGPNPLSFSPIDFELGYVTQKGYQGSLSVTGLLVGLRHTSTWGGYVTLGPGIILSAAGAGPGIFSEFGVDFRCGWFCWSAAYTQGIGITQNSRLTHPYAVRLGVSIWFK